MRGFLTAAVKTPSLVMAGLVPATHVFATAGLKTWVRGSSPRMTGIGVLKVSEIPRTISWASYLTTCHTPSLVMAGGVPGPPPGGTAGV